MSRVRNRVTHRLKILGWPALAGGGLVIFAAIFYALAIIPANSRLEQVRQETATVRETLKRMAQQGMEG